MAGTKPRVALVAIASNEAAYISSFIFHHLSLGFDPIVVVANRSQDGTEAIVQRIAQHFAGVRLVQGDAILAETGPLEFQRTAYRRVVDGLRRELGSKDYIGFLDIDEYWTPLDESSDIQGYLAAYGYPDAAAFNWYVPDNDDRPFLLPFQSPQRGRMDRHVKAVWRASWSRKRFNAHNLQNVSGLREVMASGAELEPNRCRTATKPSGPGTACIVHQMYRSLVEYVAVLGRGRSRRNAMFKDNRDGFRTYRGQRKLIRPDLPQRFEQGWRDDYARFVERTGVLPLLLDGRRATLGRATDTLRSYLALPEEERRLYDRPFQGVEMAAFEAQLDEIARAGALDGLFPSYEMQAERDASLVR